MKYLFYLEPYSFILKGKRQTVVYNTINSSYITCPDHTRIVQIIDQLNNSDNGYGVIVSEEDLRIETLRKLITDVRDSFSGDCVVFDDTENVKPFIFKPTLFLNSLIRTFKEENINILGEKILTNLTEVTVHLPSTCADHCSDCAKYSKQMTYCSGSSEGKMTSNDYNKLWDSLETSGIGRVNITGGKFSSNKLIRETLNQLNNFDFKKVFYLNFKHLSDTLRKDLDIKNATLNVSILPEDIHNNLLEDMQKYLEGEVTWRFIVTDVSHLEIIEHLDFPESEKIQITPFYTGDNIDFFKDFVFLDLDSIISEPISRKTLFRREVLNDNFFGKLIITPSGEVFSNINFPSIGNIITMSLKELVFNELTKSKIWLKTRENEYPCNNCVNRSLCPPLSNYEIIIGKPNLCHVIP